MFDSFGTKKIKHIYVCVSFKIMLRALIMVHKPSLD